MKKSQVVKHQSSDLSLMDQVNLEPNVVFNSSDKPFHPPKNFNFLEKRFGKETFNRSCQCQSQWFNDHQWLHDDVGRDSLFCYVCQNGDDKSQLQTELRKEDTFISTGFKNCKKALEKFKKHQNSLCHKASLTYEEVVPQCGDVIEMTDDRQKPQG